MGPLLLAGLLGCTADKDTATPSATDTAAEAPAHALLEPGRRYNTAHRGGADLWPEHTLLAYQGAIDAGADVLELDLHATSDGVIVMMHDGEVDRTTDGTGDVSDFTFAELRKLDAGYRFTADGGQTHPYRGKGLQVPTLEEVLAAHPDALFSIETKQSTPSITAPTLDLIYAAGVEEQVVLSSFNDNTLAELRAAAPDILSAIGLADGFAFYTLEDDDLDEYEPPTPYFAAPADFSGVGLTPELIARAHQVGIVIHAWTVNDPDQMRELLDWGVDGIITDDPVSLEAVLDEG